VRVVFLGRSRVLWRQAMLQAVTLGIYRRVWLHRINKEVDGHQALGLNHRLHAIMLWTAALGVAVAAATPSIGLGTVGYVLAALCLAPTSVVQLWTARRTAAMLQGSDVRYGPATWMWAISLVPILGGFFFIAWQQTRLNRFWAYERAHPGRGLEVEVELGSDPRFLVELDRARRESYYAGSRFDARRNERKARWSARRAAWSAVQAERRAVREAGGSTPIWPWSRPQRPRHLNLAVTCGRCSTRFNIERDPTAETPLVCPKCGLAEVIPALAENPLAPSERAAVPTVKARCPKCHTDFTAVRNLFGPTTLVCPSCGRTDTLAGDGPASRPPRGPRRGRADPQP